MKQVCYDSIISRTDMWTHTYIPLVLPSYHQTWLFHITFIYVSWDLLFMVPLWFYNVMSDFLLQIAMKNPIMSFHLGKLVTNLNKNEGKILSLKRNKDINYLNNGCHNLNFIQVWFACSALILIYFYLTFSTINFLVVLFKIKGLAAWFQRK